MQDSETEWSDEEIARWGLGLRRFSKQRPDERLNILKVVRGLEAAESEIAIQFVEVPDAQLPYAAAQAEPKSRTIKYRRSLMSAILSGDAASIEIVLEEIGHVFLHLGQLTLNHFLGVDVRAKNIDLVARKEREARKFAWYALAPIEEVYSVTNPKVLRDRFGLSEQASSEYVTHIRRVRAKIEGKTRDLPDNVVSFKEAMRRKFGSSERSTSAPPHYSTNRSHPPPESETPVRLLAQQIGYLPSRSRARIH